MTKESATDKAIREYQKQGGKLLQVADAANYSVSGIYHLLKREEIETNPPGRPPVRTSTRSTATLMRLSGHKIEYISAVLPNVSKVSLWRIFGNMKRQETSLEAVGAVIAHPQTGEILIHQEIYPNDIYHNYEGDHSVQMTWKGDNESIEATLNRLVEREVFGGTSIKKIGFENLLVPDHQTPIVRVVVADVAVNLFSFTLTEQGLVLPKKSDKVKNIRFEDPHLIVTDPNVHFRAGAREMVEFYSQTHHQKEVYPDHYFLSDLNVDFLDTFVGLK